jgi:hypothetical protein
MNAPTNAPNDPSILAQAAHIVDSDRERTYGDPGKNLRTIANLWDSWLLARGWSGPGLNTDDVALMMVLLKVARLALNPLHHDSQVDAAGYLRLLQRTQQAEAADVGGVAPPPPGGQDPATGGGG